jgi:phage-related protein
MSDYQLDGAILDSFTLDGEPDIPTPSTDDITFNGYGLQNTSIRTRYVKESAPSLELNRKTYPRANGAYAETAYWRETKISLRGNISKPTQLTLEQEMDTIRKNLAVYGGLLKMTFAGQPRYYECYATGLENIFSERDHFNVTFTPYQVDLVALHPFGRSENRDTFDSTYAITTASTNFEIVHQGTAVSEPIIYLSITTAGSASAITFTNTANGEAFTITDTFSDGDFLAIDCEQKTVKKNSVAVDYTGILPVLLSGSNTCNVAVTGAGYSIGLSVQHYQRYY